MQQQVYQLHDVDELKERLIDVWHGFEQSVINDAGAKMAQTSLREHSCESRKFWASNLTLYNACVILPIIFVSFVNTKQELLCYVQKNFASFGLLCFAR